MRNLELKAPLGDRARAEQIALELGAEFGGEWRQLDTYFVVPHGRLKLREVDQAPSELIGYERPERGAVRWSDYHTAPVAHGPAIRDVLARALGVRVQVDKMRRLYLYRGARIHLDGVRGLGAFIEFEVPCNDGDEAGAQSLMRDLMRRFALSDADALRASYAELLETC
jgi:adenylate cyclase class IV